MRRKFILREREAWLEKIHRNEFSTKKDGSIYKENLSTRVEREAWLEKIHRNVNSFLWFLQ